MTLLSIIRSIASSKLYEINERINVRLVRSSAFARLTAAVIKKEERRIQGIIRE